MSGIAGIYHLDGRPVDPALLTRMTDVIAHRGPDGVGHWIDGPVGLGHRMLHTTPESLQEKQPLANETGDLCLTLDGRVDNRDELGAALEAKGARLRTDTDAELVLRSYEAWGEGCPKRIIGDFAFAIWDRRNRQLFCARDPLGIKPFYYHTDGRTFLFGSELRQLFEDPTVPHEPNEGMIGEYLANAITHKEETLYRGILRLPPVHTLVVQPGLLRKERYRVIDPAREIRYRTDAEYAEHFSEIFKEVVRCRLRSHRPIGAYLSGGLDSSSIVGVAQSLYCDGVLTNPGFETFSLVFPGFPCDESTYIEDVVRMWGIKSNLLNPEEANGSCLAEEVRRHRDFPHYPNGTMWYPLKALARAKGFRVLLTGLGGDEWLTGSYYHYADLLRRFRILSLMRQAYCNSDGAGITSLASALRFALRPLLPRSVHRAIRWTLKRDGVPRWMDPQFARRIHLVERLRTEAFRHRSISYAKQDIYNVATCGRQIHGAEMEERADSWFGLEQRHPLDDWRVIEFALALPEDQHWRRDSTKFVLRQAMRGLLPETVQQRQTKAEFSVTFATALQCLGGEHLIECLGIASMGWVDREHVRAMYREMVQLYTRGQHEGYIMHVYPLWMIFGIELWFNLVFLNREVFPPAERRIQDAVPSHLGPTLETDG